MIIDLEMQQAQTKNTIRSFFLGGLLPVIIFTVIEEYWGTTWGLVAGMVFGVGEMTFEYVKERKISPITLGGNALLIVLGIVALWAKEGIWFKLQPAIMEFVFAILLIGSFFMKKSFLIAMAKRQQPGLPVHAEVWMHGLTFRLGLFFLLQTALAVWSAISWSTTAWALLKGLGVPVSMVIYLIVEVAVQRRRVLSHRADHESP